MYFSKFPNVFLWRFFWFNAAEASALEEVQEEQMRRLHQYILHHLSSLWSPWPVYSLSVFSFSVCSPLSVYSLQVCFLLSVCSPLSIFSLLSAYSPLFVIFVISFIITITIRENSGFLIGEIWCRVVTTLWSLSCGVVAFSLDQLSGGIGGSARQLIGHEVIGSYWN